jgi:hypothetical protein
MKERSLEDLLQHPNSRGSQRRETLDGPGEHFFKRHHAQSAKADLSVAKSSVDDSTSVVLGRCSSSGPSKMSKDALLVA